jgi:flagellar basal-body rod modification protein FlgD
MPSISAIGSTSGVNLQASSLGLEDFLKILLTQLTFQDPLKPMDNQQFMAQMAQFTSLEQTQQLNSKLDSLLSTQASLNSVGLIGRTVEVNTESGPVTGTVSRLTLSGDAPVITVTVGTSGNVLSDVSLSQIISVR